ncbi:MAG: hypothetical protein WKF78_06390 [Candidatus Limnocylindrales bacterium]
MALDAWIIVTEGESDCDALHACDGAGARDRDRRGRAVPAVDALADVRHGPPVRRLARQR